jgi:hypothetical protein
MVVFFIIVWRDRQNSNRRFAAIVVLPCRTFRLELLRTNIPKHVFVSGNNAYFIRNDLDIYLQGRVEEYGVRVSVFRESRNSSGELTFVRGLDRANLIAEIPVHHLERNELLPLGELQPLYSDDWLRAQTVGATKN